MEQFIIYALVGGVGVAILAGLLGNFVLWNKMSYFGDSLSHTTLLGISLALMINAPPMLGAFIIAVIFALIFKSLNKKYDNDTILGILAYSGLALSMIVISNMKNVRIDLIGYLFGDILTITKHDIVIIYSLCLIVSIWLKIYWKSLILAVIDKNLAKLQSKNIDLVEFQLILFFAVIVVISVKLVGILLITALLIIPSATSKNLSISPFQMLCLSMLFGILSVIIGVFSSLLIDTPSGPSIIVISLIFFIISLFFKRKI